MGHNLAPLRDMVSYRLSRVQAKLNAQAIRILKTNGDLSLMQWRVLVILDVLDTSTHSEIARLTEFDKGLLSRTIKRMVDADLIHAAQSKTDNRQFQLTMSQKGREKYDMAQPHMRARQSSLLNSMPEAEIQALFRALGKLEAAAEASGEES